MAEVTGAATPAGPGEQQFVREVSGTLFEANGWMKFLGVLMIVFGVICALTIIGIIICWLPIWVGVLLMKAAKATENAQATGNKQELLTALTKLKTYFMINGIVALISLIVGAAAVILGGVASIIPFMAGH